MPIMEQVDYFLVENFQQFAHYFQRLTGRTNFWLAALAYKIHLLNLVIFIAVSVIKSVRNNKIAEELVFLILLFLIALGIGKITMLSVKRCEKKDRDFFMDNQGLMNLNLIILSAHRIMVLLMTSVNLFGLGLVAFVLGMPEYMFILLFGIFYVIAIYFEACTPLPPGKSKVKEWLEAWKAKRKLVTAAAES
jgi:hypothetical protein